MSSRHIKWWHFLIVALLLSIGVYVFTGLSWAVWLFIVVTGAYAWGLMSQSLRDSHDAMNEGFKKWGSRASRCLPSRAGMGRSSTRNEYSQ